MQTTIDLAMPQRRHKHQLALFVRKFPFTVAIAQALFRLTRPRFSVGAVGVVFNDADQVLLVEHIFHPYAPWGLPGGWVERGENPRDAVVRELREELELEVEVGSVVTAELGFAQHLDLAFLCRPLSDVGRLSNELADYCWTQLDAMPKLHRFHALAVAQAIEIRGLRV
jgi:8-oxo-dGTP pyrophosphatase MutT (NUDIX family)